MFAKPISKLMYPLDCVSNLTKPQIRKPPNCDWSKSNWLTTHENVVLFTCESIAKPANKHRQQSHTSACIDSAHLSQWAWAHSKPIATITVISHWQLMPNELSFIIVFPPSPNASTILNAMPPCPYEPWCLQMHFLILRSLFLALFSLSLARRLNRNRKTNNIGSINNNNNNK